MFLVKCDNCGALEDARPFPEPVNKPMFVEPRTWIRRFDNKGGVIAVFCCYNCEKAFIANTKISRTGQERKPGTGG